jgi:hypothetical protein
MGRCPMSHILPVLFISLSLATSALSQTMPPIGTIDYYGLRQVPRKTVEKALEIKPGEQVSKSLSAAEKRLEALPGVVRARLDFVCCDAARKTILYVGIEEDGASALRFRPAPKGNVKLPAEIVNAGRAFEDAFMKAVVAGDVREDDSRGYSLSHNPETRAVQERFVGFAARDLPFLRDVLHNSSDADQRALAAEVMGYDDDHRAVVPDLEYGMSDPNFDVRNNSMRALAVIAAYARAHPSRGIEISPRPFIKLLNSLVWEDRDKAGFALMQLTNGRDPALLAELRRDALPALIEMARWKTPGHAQMFCVILGRIAGLPDKEIGGDLRRDEKEKIIAAALTTKAAQGIDTFRPPHHAAARLPRATRAAPAAIQASD